MVVSGHYIAYNQYKYTNIVAMYISGNSVTSSHYKINPNKQTKKRLISPNMA